MFINLSNHPLKEWSSKQLDEAKRWGDVLDIPFPNVSPSASKRRICSICKDLTTSICESFPIESTVIHIMGEMTLTFALVTQFKALGYTCLASTSERKVIKDTNGDKIVHFEFVQFREY